jgi:cytochrome c
MEINESGGNSSEGSLTTNPEAPMKSASAWQNIAAGTALAISAAVLAPHAASAQPNDAERGMKLAQEKCARCHATGKADASPDPKAPPFRNVGRNYPPEHLAEALAEGIVTGDNAMPEFKFDPRDVDAIIDYLEMISSDR